MLKLGIIFGLGLIIGGGVVWWLARKRNGKRGAEGKANLIEKQAREKEENKHRILGVLETQTPLTNNHIEQLLGISDATATRYLEELEKEGKVRQVGTTGRHVYYEKANGSTPLSR